MRLKISIITVLILSISLFLTRFDNTIYKKEILRKIMIIMSVLIEIGLLLDSYVEFKLEKNYIYLLLFSIFFLVLELINLMFYFREKNIKTKIKIKKEDYKIFIVGKPKDRI